MDQIWFNRSRTAGSTGIPWNRSGSILENVDTSTILLTASSSYFTPPSGPFLSVTRASYTSNNYSTFTELSLPGMPADSEGFLSFTRDSSTGGLLGFYDSRTTPYFLLNTFGAAGSGALVNIGYSYTTDLTTSTAISGISFPDPMPVYTPPGGTVVASYSSSAFVRLGGGTVTPDKTFGTISVVQVSSGQSTPSSGLRDYAQNRAHMAKVDNTTKAVSWVRSGYTAGYMITNPTGTQGGMGRVSLPLDLTFDSIPAPSNYTNPAGSTFPGVQAKLGDIVFFDPGSVKNTADIVRTDNGSGATRNGLSNFSGAYLYVNPPSNPTTGMRNNLPLVLSVSVTAGVITSVNSIICCGSGFPDGTALYTMNWDTNENIFVTVTNAAVNTATTATFTQTTLPQFTITFYDNRAAIRFVTMNDFGDGYYWTGTAWDGVTTKETPWGATTRTYTGYSTYPTLGWTSASTSETGTFNVSMPPGGGLRLQPFDLTIGAFSSWNTQNDLSGAGGLSSPNPSKNLLLYSRSSQIGNTGVSNTQFYPYWGTPAFPASGSPSAFLYYTGQFVVCNDDLQTFQYVKLPGLTYQPNVPSAFTPTNVNAPTAGRLFYTSVPESDPFIYYLSASTTGVDNNLYVFGVHFYGEYNAASPVSSVYRYKIKMYHFQPGSDLNDISAGAVWTSMWSSPEFTSNRGPWMQVLQTFGFGDPFSSVLLSNANYRTNSPATEGSFFFRFRDNQTNATIYTNTFYFTFSSETSVTEIPTPTGLSWTPDGTPLSLQYDVVNNRYIGGVGNTAAAGGVVPSMPPGPGYILLGAGESRWEASPTITYLQNAQTGAIWPPS